MANAQVILLQVHPLLLDEHEPAFEALDLAPPPKNFPSHSAKAVMLQVLRHFCEDKLDEIIEEVILSVVISAARHVKELRADLLVLVRHCCAEFLAQAPAFMQKR